jgi:hypothetical protein
MRLLLRKMWIADLVAGLLIGAPFLIRSGSTNWSVVVQAAGAVMGTVVSLWLLRRFGLLSFVAVAFFDTPSSFPVATTGWLAGRSLALHLIPLAVAACALWLIVANQNRPAAESLT